MNGEKIGKKISLQQERKQLREQCRRESKSVREVGEVWERESRSALVVCRKNEFNLRPPCKHVISRGREGEGKEKCPWRRTVPTIVHGPLRRPRLPSPSAPRPLYPADRCFHKRSHSGTSRVKRHHVVLEKRDGWLLLCLRGRGC